MKTCEIVRDLLPLYIDGVCLEGSRELVEEHLKECEACSREYQMMKLPALEEESKEDFAAVEEQLLKEGKEQIETGVRRRIMDRLLWADVFFNIFFLCLGMKVKNLFLNATELPWYGKFMSYDELNMQEDFQTFLQFTSIIMGCFLFLICDLAIWALKKRKGENFRMFSDYTLTLSLFLKSLYAVIMAMVGFFYLYNELAGLCG